MELCNLHCISLKDLQLGVIRLGLFSSGLKTQDVRLFIARFYSYAENADFNRFIELFALPISALSFCQNFKQIYPGIRLHGTPRDRISFIKCNKK